eukprot:scaffold19013_cov71-Phaeocystis_antarctica.AAC.3
MPPHLVTHAWLGRAVRLSAVRMVQRARPRDVVHVHPARALRHRCSAPDRPRVRSLAVQLVRPRERLDVHHGVPPRRRRHTRSRRSQANACGGGDVWHYALARRV